jgi:hypothetical protein
MGILNSVTTYGKKLRSTGQPDEYALRIYTGGLATNEDADQRANEEFEKFKTAQSYSTFEIVRRNPRWFPSCVDYTVHFRR